jgi:carbamoyltransferase
MIILGISAFYHDSAAAIIRDGLIVAAAQEERFTRKKHDSNFPQAAIKYCLQEAGIALNEVDYVAFYDKPFLKFERLLETYLSFAPKGFTSFSTAIPIWLREKLFLKDLLKRELLRLSIDYDVDGRLRFSEHHLSHAASAFFPSPFERAAVLTLDGAGEWTTSSLALGNGCNLSIVKEIEFPHSLGLLYSAFTYYTGFKVNSGEYKVMGLAPYGVPRYTKIIFENLIDVKSDGSFRLDMSYFDYCTGLRMTNQKFDDLFGGPARRPEDKLTQREMDLAASIQAVCEEVMLRLTRAIAIETGESNLCLAGGVALNCVANGKILRDKSFKNIWIQPAAGDAGGAIGAAYAIHHIHLGNERKVDIHGQDGMFGSYLGPTYSNAEIIKQLSALGAKYEVLDDGKLISECANALASNNALGWFQGRMEFGPRSLGGRSILADPRSPTAQSTLNLKVKYRESFRPFAPSVLSEDVAEWFDIQEQSPYMLLVAEVVKSKQKAMSINEENLFGIEKLNVPRSDIPAVTHVDYSARVQTVHELTNPRYHALLSEFKRLTGCPVLVNTSFNVRGEPIVCSPEDAFRCFMGTEMDVLAIGNCFLRKDQQNISDRVNYSNQFELD